MAKTTINNPSDVLSAFAPAKAAHEHHNVAYVFEKQLGQILKNKDDFYLGFVTDLLTDTSQDFNLKDFLDALAHDGYIKDVDEMHKRIIGDTDE